MLKGLSCGGLIALVIRLLFKAIKILIVAAAYLLLYFGLWTVLVYMLFSGGLALWGGLDMGANDLNGILFKVGLALAFLCSLLLFLRNNLVKPLNTVFEKRTEKKERREYERFLEKRSRNNGRDTDARRNDVRRENPTIYRSANDPSKIIHEFGDRYEVFKVIDGKLVLIDVEYK